MTSRIPRESKKKSTSLWWMELKTPNGRDSPCANRSLSRRSASAKADRGAQCEGGLLVAERVGARRYSGAHVDPLDFELESDRILVVRKHFDGIRIRRACCRAESLARHEDVVEIKRELQ